MRSMLDIHLKIQHKNHASNKKYTKNQVKYMYMKTWGPGAVLLHSPQLLDKRDYLINLNLKFTFSF